MSANYKKPERRPSAFLPATGLVIAVILGVLAYFIAPYALDLVDVIQGDGWLAGRLAGGSVTMKELEYVTAGVLWLLLFATSMLIVALTIGEDPVTEEMIIRPPERAGPKEWKRYYKKMEKMEKRRAKQAAAKQRRGKER